MSLRKSAVAAAIALLVTVISIPSFAAGVKVAAGKTIIVTENSKTMKVDGNDITLEVEPQRINDRLLLPLRAFAEDALECVVSWDENTKTATITNGEKTIIVTENSKIMTVDGNDILMDIEPQRVNDRLLLPIRAFAQHALGCTVIWDENTKTATITGPSVASNPSPAETPKETEKPAEPATVIKNPYDMNKVAKLWSTPRYTRSHDDLNYILGYFIYQCCIDSNVDPMTIDFSDLKTKTYYTFYETSIDSNGKIKAVFSNTESAMWDEVMLNSIVEIYIRNFYTYLLSLDEAVSKENMTNFLIQQSSNFVKDAKDGDSSTMVSKDYFDPGFTNKAGLLYAAKTLKDFYDSYGLAEVYKTEYDSANYTCSDIYQNYFNPNVEAKRIVEMVPFRMGTIEGSMPIFQTFTYNALEQQKKHVLENLTTEESLSKYPMLNYLYGVKDGKAYIKSLDEIKEYTVSRLNKCGTYEEAKNILTVYYNVPAIYGVNCPQAKEIQKIIERISSKSLKGDNVKTSEQLATIKPLTDAEVRAMFKELTGSEMRF